LSLSQGELGDYFKRIGFGIDIPDRERLVLRLESIA
jgi:hypothetical protein